MPENRPRSHRRSPRRLSRWASRLLVGFLSLAFASSPVIIVAAESESTSYRLAPLTVNAGGEPVKSTSYRAHGSVGQEATVGTSASYSFILEAGFWSFIGTRLHPVLLMVDPGPVDASLPLLNWTGSEAPFVIHRSTDCATLALFPHTAESGNSWTDPAPPLATLACYRVFATAPGDGQGMPPTFTLGAE